MQTRLTQMVIEGAIWLTIITNIDTFGKWIRVIVREFKYYSNKSSLSNIKLIMKLPEIMTQYKEEDKLCP